MSHPYKHRHLVWLLGLSALWPVAALADTASEIVALVKAQWAAEMARAPAEQALKDVAEDYTEFNPDVPTRLDGKALALKTEEAFNQDGGKLLVGEMANEKVQVYGNVAILSYNYIGYAKNKDGEVKPIMAKSTRVYAKQGGRWMLVHANFAPVATASQP